MKNKHAQVTIFVIIAIVLVVSALLYFFVIKGSEKNNGLPSSVVPIYEFVVSCIDNNLEKVVYTIGKGGGYFFPPVLSDSYGFTYYFYDDKNYFPEKEDMERRLSAAIESEVVLCVNSFKNFPDYNISEGEIKINSKIYEDKVVFNVNYPLTIQKGNEVNIVNEFGEYSVPVRLGLIHSAIDNLIREGYYSKNAICIDCLADMIYENNLDIDILEGGVGSSVFVIKDYNEETNKTFEYIFAA